MTGLTAAYGRLVKLMHALADEKRIRVTEALRGGDACLCELQDRFDIAQSILSHHLRVLRAARPVEGRRDGHWIHYSLVAAAQREAEQGVASLRAAPESPSAVRASCCSL